VVMTTLDMSSSSFSAAWTVDSLVHHLSSSCCCGMMADAAFWRLGVAMRKVKSCGV
jgi:hypothetical protein